MTEKLDPYTGHSANSHTLTIKFTGLSSDNAQALGSAFHKILERLSAAYNMAGQNGDVTISIGDASEHRDKIVAALATAVPAAVAAEVPPARPAAPAPK